MTLIEHHQYALDVMHASLNLIKKWDAENDTWRNAINSFFKQHYHVLYPIGMHLDHKYGVGDGILLFDFNIAGYLMFPDQDGFLFTEITDERLTDETYILTKASFEEHVKARAEEEKLIIASATKPPRKKKLEPFGLTAHNTD